MNLKSLCGVYLIVSPSNGRYVGSSKRMDKRFNRYKNNSCAKQSAIYASLRKYGYEAHKVSVLMYCGEDERLFWERIFGDMYLASAKHKNGLNLLLPGYDDTPAVVTQEFRDKISATQKIRFQDPAQRENTSKRTKQGFTEEVKQRMSIIHKERYKDPQLCKDRSETRIRYYQNNPEARIQVAAKQREVMANNPDLIKRCMVGLVKYKEENPNAGRERMIKYHQGNPNAGKEHGIKMKKLYDNNEERRQMAAEKTRSHLQKHGHPLSKKIINTETNEIFNTVKEAAKSTIYCINTFREIIKGRHKIKLSYKYL